MTHYNDLCMYLWKLTLCEASWRGTSPSFDPLSLHPVVRGKRKTTRESYVWNLCTEEGIFWRSGHNVGKDSACLYTTWGAGCPPERILFAFGKPLPHSPPPPPRFHHPTPSGIPASGRGCTFSLGQPIFRACIGDLPFEQITSLNYPWPTKVWQSFGSSGWTGYSI